MKIRRKQEVAVKLKERETVRRKLKMKIRMIPLTAFLTKHLKKMRRTQNMTVRIQISAVRRKQVMTDQKKIEHKTVNGTKQII